MTTQHTQGGEAILRDVVRVIATTTEPRDCILPVLEAAQHYVGASGSGMLLFEDPRLLIVSSIDENTVPSDAVLRALASASPCGIQLHPTLLDGTEWKNRLVRQICIQDQPVGILWLVFDQSPSVDSMGLEAFVDVLTIVTMHVRSEARHEKLGRNHSEFMRVVSHDLRSPLTSMQGFASMLESGTVGELNEQQAYFVEKILAGITQMTSLVENIQDAGRFDPETGFYEMQRAPCDLTEVVQKVINNHLLPAEKQELTMEAVIADDIPIINADANMLERAITNLIDNAIKYTPNGRKVEVGVRVVPPNVVVSVRDNGLGISPEHQSLLFERHVRIPRKEHKRVKGSGLGLFIVRSVARRHGGDAWVESEEGSGSTFFIRIPLNEENSIIPEKASS